MNTGSYLRNRELSTGVYDTSTRVVQRNLRARRGYYQDAPRQVRERGFDGGFLPAGYVNCLAEILLAGCRDPQRVNTGSNLRNREVSTGVCDSSTRVVQREYRRLSYHALPRRFVRLAPQGTHG